MIPEEKVDDPALIPANWYKYTKRDVDANTKRGSIKTMMERWVAWEEETKALMESSYKELYDAGDVCAALKVSYFLKDVSKELKHAREKLIDLESTTYDITLIVSEQKELYHKYKCKIAHIFEED